MTEDKKARREREAAARDRDYLANGARNLPPDFSRKAAGKLMQHFHALIGSKRARKAAKRGLS